MRNNKKNGIAAGHCIDFFLLFLMCVGALSGAALYWIKRKIDPNATLEQIMFHMMNPIMATDSELAGSFIRNVFPWSLLILFYGMSLEPLRRSRKKLAGFCGSRRMLLLLAVLVCSSSLYYFITNFSPFTNREWGNFFDKYYSVPTEGNVHFPKKKNNLILVYLESAENTFNDPEFFSEPLMPDLAELQKCNTAFYGYRQVYGTGWTMGGIVASLFGIPLLLPFRDNDYGLFSYHFLPEALSLLDILDRNGYAITFMAGSSLKFAGMYNLIKDHVSSPIVKDKEYFMSKGFDLEKNKGLDWGYKDRFVFDRAKEELLSIDGGQPFVLVISTIDTHSPKGFADPCVPARYGDYRDAIRSSGYLTADFLKWIEKQDFYKNTTVFVVGDHLAMQTNISDEYLSPKKNKRDGFSLILNSRVMPSSAADRSFAAFDYAPTILESLGVKLHDHKFGLGTSLLSSAPTLLEKKGECFYYNEVRKKSKLYNNFYGEENWAKFE